MKKQTHNFVDIKTVTWHKDSHGLFDYECKRLTQEQYVAESTCLLVHNCEDDRVSVVDQLQLKSPKESNHVPLGIFQINPASDTFLFRDTENPLPQAGGNKKYDPYLVIRSLKNQHREQKGYPLKSGEIIKFGRLEYIVRELNDAANTYSHGSIRMDFGTFKVKDETIHDTCKVCLSDEQTPYNFLVSPCKCKGSCASIHIECLKKWIQSKICKETQGVVDSYNFTKFECEICKVPFPEKIVRNNEQYPMLTIVRPNSPYIILETVHDRKDERNLHLITFKNQEPIKLGRGHECQVRLTDISVSRIHAEFKLQKGQFLIFDYMSKFGTLIKIQNNHSITEDKAAIQIGRTVIICCVRPSDSKKQQSAKTSSRSLITRMSERLRGQ